MPVQRGLVFSETAGEADYTGAITRALAASDRDGLAILVAVPQPGQQGIASVCGSVT